MNRRLVKLAAVTFVAGTLALTGCGSRADTAPAGSAAAKKIAKIGVIAPLSGDLSALGLGIKNSVDLAIKQANDSNAIPGWTLVLAAEDDEAKPDVGKNAATKLSSDNEVVGVVGTLNSSVAQSVTPVLQPAKIVQVSPANTNPTLTQGKDAANPARPYDNYFRTCTTDAVQGPTAATYLLSIGVKEVATIHDKKSYGQGLVEAFAKAFTAGGGKVVAAQTINPDDKDFSSVITNVKAANPKTVFYGGEYPQAGPLSKQMKAAGLNVPLMGGDGIYDPGYVDLAGSAANGDLATSVGAPVESLASAKAFVTAYTAAAYKDPMGAYGAQSYDAANAIINALKVSLAKAADAKSARADTVTALGAVSFDGATGKISFDKYGDATSKVITVYKVSAGKWGTEKTLS